MLKSTAPFKKAGQSESGDQAKRAKKARKQESKKARKQVLTASKKHVKIDLPARKSETLQMRRIKTKSRKKSRVVDKVKKTER